MIGGHSCLLASLGFLAAILLTQTATACDVNCATVCVKYTGCDGVCKPLWGIIYSLASHPCGPCEPLCLSACNSGGNGTCDTTCQTGYCVNMTDHHCYVKPHCLNCSVSTSYNCTQCEAGYIVYNTSCAKCADNCTVACTYPGSCPLGKCQSPQFGFVNITGTSYYSCGPCDSNCVGGCTTRGAGKCDATCIPGWSPNSTYICVQCDAKCNGSCSVKGAGKCDAKCVFGYGVNASFNCQPCDPNCLSGCATYGAAKCDSLCAAGYSVDSTLHTCVPCDPYCNGSCSVKGGGKCDSLCVSGYGLDANFTCHPCDTNCASGCSSKGAGKCDTLCKTGYSLSPTTFNCFVCDPHCSTGCDKNLTCPLGKCMSGYGSVLLTGSTTDYGCAACERLCIGTCTASGGGLCDDLCYAGYCPDPLDHHCKAVARCVSCTTSLYPKCDVCQTGYSAVSGSCIQCDNHCAVNCTAVDTCPPGGCADPGYGSMPLTGSTQTTCSPCDANCAGSCKVKGGGKCDATCKTGYTLTATYTCQALVCSMNCLGGCATYGSGFCDCPCNAGYVCAPATNDPTKKACYPCASHCTSGCNTEGRGCCDSTCVATYTWTLATASPVCHVCV